VSYPSKLGQLINWEGCVRSIIQRPTRFLEGGIKADKKVGGVAGEKKIITSNKISNEATNQEGLYWKYESWLKQIDSNFHSVVGAAGELNYRVRSCDI
jgi:hypothetical protein